MATLALTLALGARAADAPKAEPPALPALPSMHDSAAPKEHSALKDLTPPGFADLIPPEKHGEHGGHADKHEVPENLAPAAPPERGFFATGEYLLMRPRSDNLDYAVRNRTTGLSTAGVLESLRYDLGSGLRVELGYRFGESLFEPSFAYTRLKSTGGEVIGAAPGQVLFPTLTRPGLTDSVLVAAPTVSLDYNLYDLLVGRRYAVGENLAVRGFGGIRLADIRQEFGAAYNGLDARNAAASSGTRFQGVGPLVGAEAVLAGPMGLHAYARATGALLTGPSDSRTRDLNDAGRTTYVDLSHTLRKVVPNAGIAVGAGWQYRTVSLRAGYEVSHWFGLVDRVRLNSDTAQGALSTTSGSLAVEGLFIQFGLVY